MNVDKLLRKQMSLKMKARVGIALGLGVLLLLSIMFCVTMYSLTSSRGQEQARESVRNISALNCASISRALHTRQNFVEMLSMRLSKRGIKDIDVIAHELADFEGYLGFEHMGIMTNDGMLHFTNGRVADISRSRLAYIAMNGQANITASFMPYSGGDLRVNAFTQPVYYNGEQRYVLIATYLSRDLTERMNISSIDATGHYFLVNRDGELIIYPRHYDDPDYNELMRYIADAQLDIPENGGDSELEYKGEPYYVRFEALGINDWYLMTCVRESELYRNAITVTKLTVVAVFVLWLVIIGGLTAAFVFMRKARLRRVKTTYYDQLLDVPNTDALGVLFDNLPQPLLDYTYLIALDIDKFKEFNYIYGTKTGDELLRYIADTLGLEFSDASLFRYGSDNFVLVLRCTSQIEVIEHMTSLGSRFAADVAAGKIPPFEFSAGVRLLRDGDDMRLAVSDAMIAREEIKGNHLRHFAFYDGAVRDRRLAYMEIELGFPAALRDGQFHVYYQPKYNMITRQIIGSEALARWIKPDGAMISPGDFIPCLENSRQIAQLDEEMLKSVCREMVEMQAEGIAVKPVSVNLSRIHLRNPGILPRIAAIIRESGVAPENLAFEITESALLEDDIPLHEIVDFLHSLGCRVDMDDYGVGVSGPTSLARNKFDTVKLDKSFVDSLSIDRVCDVIKSTSALANRWSIRLLAEGVETQEQAQTLVGLGCVYAQGYHFSRPLPADKYRALLRAEQARRF